MGTQWEPALESPRTAGEEHSPAWPNYFREGRVQGAARDKSTAPDSSLWTQRVPALGHHGGQVHLQQARSLSSGGGCGTREPSGVGLLELGQSVGLAEGTRDLSTQKKKRVTFSILGLRMFWVQPVCALQFFHW